MQNKIGQTNKNMFVCSNDQTNTAHTRTIKIKLNQQHNKNMKKETIIKT